MNFLYYITNYVYRLIFPSYVKFNLSSTLSIIIRKCLRSLYVNSGIIQIILISKKYFSKLITTKSIIHTISTISGRTKWDKLLHRNVLFSPKSTRNLSSFDVYLDKYKTTSIMYDLIPLSSFFFFLFLNKNNNQCIK